MNKRTLTIVLGIGTMLLLAACAGPNPVVHTPDAQGHLAGFWMGLWNGLTIFPAWVISMFNHNVQIYEVHNNGGWYNFGFVLGAGAIFGGGGLASSR